MVFASKRRAKLDMKKKRMHKMYNLFSSSTWRTEPEKNGTILYNDRSVTDLQKWELCHLKLNFLPDLTFSHTWRGHCPAISQVWTTNFWGLLISKYHICFLRDIEKRLKNFKRKWPWRKTVLCCEEKSWIFSRLLIFSYSKTIFF